MRVVLTLAVLMLMLALTAAAADPEVVQPLREGETPALTETPLVDVNQAEIEILQNGDLPEGEAVMFNRDEAVTAPALIESPMIAEIRAAFAAERTQHEELVRRFDAATDERVALSVQREIEALARDTELQILQIQIHHARLAGREEVALQIESAITEMTTPRPPAQPQERRDPNQR